MGKADNSEKKESRRKLFKKIAKLGLISFFVIIPVLWGVNRIHYRVENSLDNSKRMSVARLDETGLTDNLLISKEELQAELIYGVLEDAKPQINITQAIDQLLQEILDQFWLDDTIVAEGSYSTKMEMISVSLVITTQYPQEAVSWVFNKYANDTELNQNFDRLTLIVNGELYEQTKLRVSLGKSWVPVSSVALIGNSLDLDDLKQSIKNESVDLMFSTMSFSSTKSLIFITGVYNPELEAPNVLDGYFNMFGCFYKYIGENPDVTIVFRLTGNKGSVETWFDAPRVMQYGTVLNSLQGNSKQGFILQFHKVLGYWKGDLAEQLSELFIKLTS